MSRSSARIPFCILISFLTLLLVACGNAKKPTTVTLQSITVQGSNTVAKGNTVQLTATGTFKGSSSQSLTGLTWSSSNTALATIDATGVVTGKGQGTVTITASASGVQGTFTLQVTPAVLASLQMSPATSSVAAGLQDAVVLSGTLSDGSSATSADFTKCQWTSSIASVATVAGSGGNGMVSTLKTGSPAITANCGGLTQSVVITVTAAVLDHIVITPDSPSVPLGVPQQFWADGVNTDKTTTPLVNCQWQSSSGGVYVDDNGLATAKWQGTVTITVTANGMSANTSLTVTAPAIASISIQPAATSFMVGATDQLTAQARMTDNSSEDVSSTASWLSGDTAIATMDGAVAGLVHGVAQGPVTITATEGGQTGTANLTVTPGVSAANGLLYIWPTYQPNLYAYGIQADDTLTLMPGSPMTNGSDPGSGDFALDPTGTRIYSTSGNNVEVWASSIDSQTGALTEITGSPFMVKTGNISSRHLIFDPVYPMLHVDWGLNYVSLGLISATTYDQASGALGSGFLSDYRYDGEYDVPIAFAFTSDNSLLFTINVYIGWEFPFDNILERSAVNATDGGLTGAGELQGLEQMDIPLWVSPARNFLYCGTPTEDEIHHPRRKLELIDISAGMTDTGYSVDLGGARPYAIAFDSEANVMYVASATPSTPGYQTAIITSWAYDPNTGHLTALNSLTLDPSVYVIDDSKFGLTLAPDGKVLYLSAEILGTTTQYGVEVIGIDSTTHAMTVKQTATIPSAPTGDFPRQLLVPPPRN